MGIAGYASYFREQVTDTLQLDSTHLKLASSILQTAGICSAIYATIVLVKHLQETAAKTEKLFRMITRGNTQGMQHMLDSGANPEANVFFAHPFKISWWGVRPLHYCMVMKKVEAARALIEKNAHINTRTPFLETPLHFAVSGNFSEGVEMLLEKGANTHNKDIFGSTPLHTAASLKNLSLTRLLLEKGADPNSKNLLGQTPLHIAIASGDAATAKLLIENGAHSYKDVFGQTPLGLAAKNPNLVEIMRQLLTRGDAPNVKSYIANNPLHIAAIHNNAAAIDILARHGADLNQPTPLLKFTPLHVAIKEGNYEAVEMLLRKGANPEAKTRSGATVYTTATFRNQNNITALLLRYKHGLCDWQQHPAST